MEKVVSKVKGIAKDITNVTALKLKIVEKEGIKETKVNNIGKVVYNTYPALDVEEMNTMLTEIKLIDEEIESLQEEIRIINKQVKCTNCGTIVKDEMNFCGNCGSKIEKPEESENKASDVENILL